MALTSEKPIQSLWPLPGGNDRYLNTLDEIVKWVATTPEPTRDKLRAWLASQYSVGENSVSGYLQVAFKLGVIQTSADDSLSVTPLGSQVLEAQGEAKARPVVERFMRDYLAFREVLAVFAASPTAVNIKDVVVRLQSQFPQWTSPAQFEYRVLWLLSLGCLRQTKGRTYEVTEFGEAISQAFPAAQILVAPIASDIHELPEPTPIAGQEAPADEVSRLIADLEAASTDSKAPQHLERAVANAFEFLGFAVDQMGESGETDILVRANIGPDSYSAVVDAKARREGKLLELEVLTLQDHLRKNEADYAMVVAGGFSGGKVVRHAEETRIVLLGVPVLADWLRLHNRTPLNLKEHQAMFLTPGLVPGLPVPLKAAAEKRLHWSSLLVDLMELIQETYEHGLNLSLTPNHLFTMLVTRLRGVRHANLDVQAAIALLTHPAVSAALGDAEKGISLAMNRATLVRTLRALAHQIEAAEPET